MLVNTVYFDFRTTERSALETDFLDSDITICVLRASLLSIKKYLLAWSLRLNIPLIIQRESVQKHVNGTSLVNLSYPILSYL